MNSAAQQIDPATLQQLQLLQKQLAVQVYSSIILAAGFAILVIVTILVATRWNRTALAFLAIYGFFTFWIPSAPTLYLSPAIFFTSVAGLVYLSLTSKRTASVAPGA